MLDKKGVAGFTSRSPLVCDEPTAGIHVEDITVDIGTSRILTDVCVQAQQGSSLSILGPSGCGKTTLGRSILRLIEPSSGEVLFRGKDILKHDKNEMRAMRRKMQIIFQDPYASLNPRMTIGSILEEPLIIHNLYSSKEERRKRLYQLLEYVQLPKDALNKYPHEFSGGQRQRVWIARALAVSGNQRS